MFYQRPRILIVDHDVDNCEMLPILLDRNMDRYEITTTYSCREAREMIRRRRFDLYILDYFMPDMTGAQFCTTLRQLDANGAVIMYSAMNTAHVRTESIRNGADLFLLKPDDLDLLGASVEELLQYRNTVNMQIPMQLVRPTSMA
jgi:DNA-binding response OmpR family regulator